MSWIAAAGKIAPYLAEIALAAIPHFTQRKPSDPVEIEDKATTRRQIAELQDAVTRNADHIRKLAADLQVAMGALEDGAAAIEARFRRLERIACAALAISALAVAAVIAVLLR